MPKYICLRVRTTLTGRFVSRAASAATTVCGQQRSPLPKPPPTNGEMTRTDSTGRSNTVESSVWVPTTHWVLSHTVSLSPFQRAMVACGSIGLWWLRAMR